MRHVTVVVVVLAVVAATAELVGSGPHLGTARAHGLPPGWISLAAGRREFARMNRGFPVHWPTCARPGTYSLGAHAPGMGGFAVDGGSFVLFESNQRHPSLTIATTHGHPHIRPPVTYGGLTWHVYAYRSNLVILHVFPDGVTVVIEAPGSYAAGFHAAAAFSHVGVCL